MDSYGRLRLHGIFDVFLSGDTNITPSEKIVELELRAKYFRCGIGSDPQWILMADYGKDGSHGVFDFSLCGEPNITPSEISWSLSHVPLSNKLNHVPIMSCHRSSLAMSHIFSLASLRLE
jgi:hypothetical protein